MVKPGTIDARSEKFPIWRLSIVFCENAAILIGTLAILSSRLSALTISDRVLPVSTLGALGPLDPGASLAKAYGGRHTQADAGPQRMASNPGGLRRILVTLYFSLSSFFFEVGPRWAYPRCFKQTRASR